MTHIVPAHVKTNKQLRELLYSDPDSVRFEDPSIFPGACSGTAREILDNQVEIGRRGAFQCTNHPKRSWFAEITYDSRGRLKVS